jgi:cysteine desulfurase
MSRGEPFLYFDNNATTATDSRVLEEMLPFLQDQYGNPSSAYRFGKRVSEALETARARVANLIGADVSEIVFTSCGTEATNAAIQSAVAMDRDRQHIVTSRVEHSATLKTCESLAKRGYEVTWLGVDGKGQIRLEELEKVIRSDTALVTLMWANNETGTVFPVDQVRSLVREKGVFFHSDAVQAAGKLPVNVSDGSVQFLSLSGHKLHCPKGIGALYINRKSRFESFLKGGGQEGGRRAGTENVASIVGFGKACELACEELKKGLAEGGFTCGAGLRDRFEELLKGEIQGVEINGDLEARLPNTSNVRFEGADGEMVLQLLDESGLCCSAGSACTSGSVHASHVLKAMGLSETQARESLRFSFSRLNREEELEPGVQKIAAAVKKVRASR